MHTKNVCYLKMFCFSVALCNKSVNSSVYNSAMCADILVLY